MNGKLSIGKDVPSFKQYFGNFSYRFRYSIYEAVYKNATGKTLHEKELLKAHEEFKPDMWYINTIVMPEYAQLAIKLGVPYAVHVHELPQEYDFQPYEGFRQMLDHAIVRLCASETVVENLNDMGYEAVVMHGLINVEDIQVKQDRAELRRKLGIPENAFVWLMSGAWSPRKGFDYMPQLLRHLPQDTYFVWMGSARKTAYTYYVERYTKQFRQNVIFLTEQAEHYYDYFNCCDGFALTSREDSYPIVMREAAVLGKPIVGFSSGGITEFVKPGMGEVVEGFNVREMAAAMQRVMTGETPVSETVLRNAITPDLMRKQGQRWSQVLEKAMNRTPTSDPLLSVAQ
ncbi:glycosyltransferase family 4 protein [Tellurirhabdus rosea]|uniref:glycosyltransferase family 4 protein n=1 Tax=Tellurirhabdus rosea TaxID=2674997 RepID=UPI00224E60C0|nr:glycosyltransferase family 4 protein [Tellurirhabdus rosea]